jgi:hypothetical protein
MRNPAKVFDLFKSKMQKMVLVDGFLGAYLNFLLAIAPNNNSYM